MSFYLNSDISYYENAEFYEDKVEGNELTVKFVSARNAPAISRTQRQNTNSTSQEKAKDPIKSHRIP
jgi:hypothetical protein